MRLRVLAMSIVLECALSAVFGQLPVDPALAKYISEIRAVDNHTHVNTTVPNDAEADALPLDGLPAFPLPARLKPDHPDWMPAFRALYGYQHNDLSPAHLTELGTSMRRVAREQGTRFPTWVLDQIGTEVMLANRIAMGPGLAAPRFRWVSFADPLLLPLSTAAERTASPDYQVLYPLEEKLLRRYLDDLHISKLPATLDEYLKTIVTRTLENQRQAGCVAVKFEVAYLRALDFADASEVAAARVYARYINQGAPSHADYKTLQDFLFRYIAREAGRLQMAVHIHSIEGAGGFYRVAGSDPLLLEPALNDPTLRSTRFVIVHGGGVFSSHTGAMLWKPNVYTDMSFLTVMHAPAALAGILREWLLQFPERVLFGSDAFATGPESGWELAAWVATNTARQALGIALTGMVKNGEVTMARAQEIATMVMRTNAGTLYNLQLR